MRFDNEKMTVFRGLWLALGLLGAAIEPSFADDVVPQPLPNEPPANSQQLPNLAPSANPAINLINLLVKRGVISKAEAAALIKQANDDAAKAQAAEKAAAASEAQSHTANSEAKAAEVAAAAAQAAAIKAQNAADYAQATAAKAEAAAKTDATAQSQHPDSVRVSYVPEPVKKQLRDEIKDQVMAQARAENWAAPNSFPDWVRRLHPYGDLRARYEGDFFPPGNDDTGAFPNYNAINTGSPFDISLTNQNFPPERDVDENRNRYRLRARFGIGADLPDDITTDIRFATGENNQPVSENQTLGAANSAQGGEFSKYQIWLDRAYIKYDPMRAEKNQTSLTVGRFDNPFFSTNLIWWEDPIAMDGAVVQDNYRWRQNITGFFTGGVFPIFNTDVNFASNQPAKFSSEDKWLFAAQTGAKWQIAKEYDTKFGVAYYDFYNVSGQESAPCTVNSSADICSTDDLRPSFAQFGNSYMPLRNIIPNAANNNGTINQFQYYGLASQFHELALTGRIDYTHYKPLHLILDTEFVDNLGFNKGDVHAKACNPSWAPLSTSAYCSGTDYLGGNLGYLVRLTVGKPEMANRWDWTVGIGYRYIESDAVIDAFNDPDFGLGGTNLQGFTLSGALALSSSMQLGLRLLSADSIAGPAFAVDVVQLDLSARF